MDLLAYLLAKKAASGDAAAAEAAAKAYTDAAQDAELFDRKVSFGLLLNYVRQHEIEAQYGTVTLTNSLAFPFNDSQKTVSLTAYMPDTHYAVVTQIKSAVGNPGEVEVFDKLTNGFKLKTTGSASGVVVDYIVIGGFTE